jgi:hypothetical protein
MKKKKNNTQDDRSSGKGKSNRIISANCLIVNIIFRIAIGIGKGRLYFYEEEKN